MTRADGDRGRSAAGWQTTYRTVDDARYLVVSGGDGPPVLLLHGFPQTHVCWEEVATGLAQRYHVVAPDLRGYGASEAPAGGPEGQGYTKREMAAELVTLMARLGHDRFAVVGHDRGARVAFRMALDHPQRLTRAALLNILPTIDQFERMSRASLGYWPWFLLAQPAPFPERILGSDPDALLDHVFATWPSSPDAIGSDHRRAYRRAMTPSTIAAMCADYRASFHLDRRHDADDRAAGRRVTVPLLVATGRDETQLDDAAEVWRRWAVELTVTRISGGHFVPEEAPRELIDVLAAFLEDG